MLDRPRRPGARVRLVPNETLLLFPLAEHLGELVQEIADVGADQGVSIELDTSERTRPGELRGGAAPIEGIALFILGGAGGFVGSQLSRLGDRIFDAAVEWVLRHRQADGPADDPIAVTLYGPDGEPLKKVLVPQGQGHDAPPQER